MSLMRRSVKIDEHNIVLSDLYYTELESFHVGQA